jgi:hypothetical protein
VALGESPEEAMIAGSRLSGRVVDGPRGEQLAIIEHRDRVPGGGDRGHEAWVLRRVLGWGERDAARALDCSRTALRLHLDARPRMDDAEEARRIGDIRDRMRAVRPGAAPIPKERDLARRRMARLLVLGVLAVTVLAVATRFLQ